MRLRIELSKPMKRLHTILILVVASAIVLSLTAPAFAQCAMCKAALEGSADAAAASKGLNLAALVLLIPPVSIFAGLFGVIYRFRNFQGRSERFSRDRSHRTIRRRLRPVGLAE